MLGNPSRSTLPTCLYAPPPLCQVLGLKGLYLARYVTSGESQLTPTTRRVVIIV